MKEMGIIDGAEKGSSSGGLTFSKMVANMLPQGAKQRLLSNIARRCCSCGGLPPGCNCHSEVLETTSWDKWPRKVLDYLAHFVTMLLRRLKRQRELRQAKLAFA